MMDMKKIFVFCIPAHGHTNPILPVLKELVSRGHEVRFYSFDEFEEKIRATGAVFISCNRFLPQLTEEQAANLKKVSATEMSIQDIRITMAMNDFLEEEFKTHQPDVVYSDSVCFWGKLNAWKFKVPLVISTSTFAFNQISSRYMKNSPKELAGLITGTPKVQKELKKLEAYGYKNKGVFSLVQSDNATDSVVYTSRKFQPYAECFSDHFIFVGPSVFSDAVPVKNPDRPLVYISMGTVINDRPDFYHKCIEALKDLNAEVVISCGNTVDIASLGTLPENVKVFPSVNQLDILSKASAFITHCGMNSVSESLYMATPMVLYPQTNEQNAVARRAKEIGAGEFLRDDSVSGIRSAVRQILETPSYAEAAKACSDDFRSCPGVSGAADFIEGAPHVCEGIDVVKEFGKKKVMWQVVTNLAIIILGILLFRFIDAKYMWIYIVAAVLFSTPLSNALTNLSYRRLVRKAGKA